MKRTFKKLIAVLIAAIMVVGLVPVLALAEAIGSDAGETESKPMPNGYIPAELHGARAVSTAYERGDMETYYKLTGATRDTLPSSYDSRNYNYVTSVKDQNPYGSCWAHAAMGSVESYMIKHGVPVGTGSAATTSLNLSETQHCFFNYTSAYDAEGMLTGDKTTVTASGAKNGLDCGGNGEMSSYTLQRWTGAADESVSALQYSKASTVASSGLSSTYAYNNNVCHVQNSEWIPATDIEGVKRAIMEYGAGNISYYAGGNTTYTYTYQCTIDTSSQDSSSHKWANHAITLVGWDDSIAASKFSPNKPSGSGAWLCKNSWGTSYFNSGYMYISYEDTSVLEGYIYFYDAEPIDNYDHNYQYDGTCNPVCYGKGWDTSTNYYLGFANNTKVANVFTATGSQMLEAIAFCSWDEALTYTVDIYKNPTTGNPSSGTKVSTVSGTLTYSGYYTIPLDTPVLLAQGDTFSVVITQSCPTADDNGKYIHTPYDATFNNSNVVDWANWTHTNHGNTSYYQEPNGSWIDCPENGDYRIKAFTKDYVNTYTVTAESNNNSYGTVSVTGTVITATPAAGYYVESCTVVSGTATYTINGNTISVSPESDCTIRVNFAPKPTYTVNYIASGTPVGNATAYVNDAVTLPTTCSVTAEGWEFIGWVSAQLEETTNAPTYYAPGASYTVTGNATLYALYTRNEDGGDVIYQLADSIEDGEYYIIVAQGSISGTSAYAAGNTVVTSNKYLTPVAVTVNTSDNTVTATSANLPKVLWKAAGNDSSGYSFYNEAVSKYMALNSAEVLYPATSGIIHWLYESTGNLNNQVDSEGYYYMSYSDGSDSVGTARYTTSNGTSNAINLYKQTTSGVTYYTTDPVASTPTYTVTFKDWDGTVLKTEEVEQGASATAPANPTREGYTFTGWDVAFTNVQSDLVVTAQYTINSYTLTVYYVYADGTTARTPYMQTYNYGASYSVASPSITGYTPDMATVTGTMGAANVEKTVTYTANVYQLTINYVDTQGNAVAPAYTGTVAYGQSYSVTSPTVEGYTPNQAVVEGTMGAGNVTVTVTYTEVSGPEPTMLGDVNCDGKVTMADVSALIAKVMNVEDLSEQGLINADANQDGKVDILDAAAIYAIALSN